MNADGTTEREMCAVSAWSAKEERGYGTQIDSFCLCPRAALLHAELQERLQNIGISVLPAGVLEPWASGVIAYCVGTSTNQLRWFRLANRGFVVRGRLGSETSTFDASGDVVETQPYRQVGYLQNSFAGEYSVSGISLSFYAGLFAYGGW
ncbi:putative tRNA pseudouridine synthase 1 [Ixodes scapularis]